MMISLASSDSAFAISTICCWATPRFLTVASGSICRSSEASTSRVWRISALRSTIDSARSRSGSRPRKMFSATVMSGASVNSW
jgi:hypothetical protein